MGRDPPDRPAGKAAPDRAQERQLEQAVAEPFPVDQDRDRARGPALLTGLAHRADSIATNAQSTPSAVATANLCGQRKDARGAEMKFGVFDHIDDAGVPLGQLYADRLTIAEAYDRARLLRLPRRRASHDAARRRRLAGADHGGAGLPHQEPAVRPAGLSAAVLSSAAPDRRGLHARPDERRALPARRRARRLDVRDGGLRPRLQQDPGDVPRGVPGAAQGPRLGRAELRRASSTSSTRCR